jgi:hypothetical protein
MKFKIFKYFNRVIFVELVRLGAYEWSLLLGEAASDGLEI